MQYETAEQRKLVYEFVLERVYLSQQKQCLCYLCPAILHAAGVAFERGPQTRGDVIRYFPEFAAQKPDYSSVYDSWWRDDDYESRITALQNAIQLCDTQQ